MYKYICIVLLVFAMKAESSILSLSNEPKMKLEIELENHIVDFVQLLDMQKLIELGINYMTDEEVLKFVAFVTSSQFKEIVFDIESMPEFRQASAYLASNGYDVDYLIDYINDALDLPAYQQPKNNVKYGQGISGLIEDFIETLPLADMGKLLESKLIYYPEITKLFGTINSEEFLGILRRLSQNPKLRDYKNIFENYGFDFNQICTMSVKIFGKYYQGVFCG